MDTITLALAKGRTAKDSISLLDKMNICFKEFHEKSRKLVFHSTDQSVKLIFVKAVDVPTYVEKGAADIGIVGRDNILEAQADVYEMLDLGIGKCRFVVAGYADQDLKNKQKLMVASKYPTVTRNHFKKLNRPIDTIKLNGSVELAPLIGLADCIVDIVETGTTIDENGLSILEQLETISTRLIVNKASFATKTTAIQDFISRLKGTLE
jgi:ATP phosphoribosyltransferase